MNSQPYKQCPRCQQPAALHMPQCGRCGHEYRTQFMPSEQTQMILPSPPTMQIPPQQPYYPPPPPQYYAPQALYRGERPDVTGYVIGAILLAFVSLLFLPPITGAGAVVCGYKVKKSGRDELGVGLMVFAAAFMSIGFMVGFMVGMRRY